MSRPAAEEGQFKLALARSLDMGQDAPSSAGQVLKICCGARNWLVASASLIGPGRA